MRPMSGVMCLSKPSAAVKYRTSYLRSCIVRYTWCLHPLDRLFRDEPTDIKVLGKAQKHTCDGTELVRELWIVELFFPCWRLSLFVPGVFTWPLLRNTVSAKHLLMWTDNNFNAIPLDMRGARGISETSMLLCFFCPEVLVLSRRSLSQSFKQSLGPCNQ